jgi:hypothetical protein
MMDVPKLTLLLMVVVLIVACSDDPSMMTGSSAMPGPPTVSNAAVIVGGVAVQGRVTGGTGETALFRVRVHAPEGPSTVQRVVMQYVQPGPNHHGGPMIGGYQGTVLCYDDGTHGDDIAGDGYYHFMDPQNQIGCHGYDAPRGNYEYHFWCEDIYSQRSNTATVTVVRE